MQRLKVLGLVAPAVELLRQCQGAGLEHVHCHSFANGAHVCALCRAMGGPGYSLTLHGDLAVYGTDHASKLRECLAVTTAGPHLVEPVAALGISPARILSNPMGVDTARFAPKQAAGEAADAVVLRLITVSRLNRNKGHRYALAAMRGLIDEGLELQYTIVGQGPYRGEIEREVGALKLEGHVKLAGGRGEAEVIALLGEHDVFVLPSVEEAAPVCLMEAMACGLPVVSSITGATPAMIRQEETGFLVPPADVAALGEALRTLAQDTELRRRIGASARAAAVREFDATASSMRLLEHLRRCGARI